MSNTSNIASRIRTRREEAARSKEKIVRSTMQTSSINKSSPQHYLLFFDESDERIILSETNITKFVDGRAVVIMNRKRKLATIEVQGKFQRFPYAHEFSIYCFFQAHWLYARRCSRKVKKFFFD
jgi:hypothetical protein